MLRLQIIEALRPVEKFTDTVLLVGDGWSAPEDIEKFKDLASDFDTYSIGRSIQLLDICDHWGNVDSDCAVWWAENLPKKARNGDFPLRHTLGKCRGFDIAWDIIGEIPWDTSEVLWHGSTALFAVLGCLEMGYKKIVLAGIPLDSKGHWYGLDGPAWTYQTYQAWFEFAATKHARHVKSLSGYTAQLLGKPTQRWLHGLKNIYSMSLTPCTSIAG